MGFGMLLVAGCGSGSDDGGAVVIDPGGIAVEGQDDLKLYLAQGYDLVSKLDEFLIRPEVITNQGLFNCLAGSMTSTHSDPDEDGEISQGDSISFTFDNCESVTGEVIDGDVQLDLEAEVILSPHILVNGSVSKLNNLCMTSSGAKVFGNGDLIQDFYIDATGKSSLSSRTKEGESVVFTMGETTFTASNYHLQKLVESGDQGGDFSIDTTVAVKSEVASYGYTVTTTDDFEMLTDIKYPVSGELVLKTLEGSAAKMTALGEYVRISEDHGGDDIFEIVNDLTWEEFDNLMN